MEFGERIRSSIRRIRKRREISAAIQADADFVLASGYFDESWYKRKYPDVAAADIPALTHYVRFGYKEGRSPGPDFDAAWYLKQYPDIKNTDPLTHYLKFGKLEGRRPKPSKEIFAAALRAVAEIADIDPGLYNSINWLDDPYRLRIVDGTSRSDVALVYKQLIEKLIAPPGFIVFVPWLRHGGADLVASNAMRAMVSSGTENVLLVLTDDSRMDATHLVPEEVQVLSFSDCSDELTLSQRAELVGLMIRSFAPRAVLNVNSRAAWEATQLYGRVLSRFTNIYATLFCADFLENGRRIGYSDEYLSTCLHDLSGIYFDNETHILEVTDRFAIPPSLRGKLIPLYQPIPQIQRVPVSIKHGRIRVLWAGRLARQKNVELLFSIIDRAPPHVEFHIWGRGEEEYEEALSELDAAKPNVHFEGPYESFADLPVEDYEALLYTSLWDGLPNVLLEGAAAGLAVVASDIGGIKELVDERTGWLVPDIHNPDSYLAALENIIQNPGEVSVRLVNMRKKLDEQHAWSRYIDVLRNQPQNPGGLIAAKTKDHHADHGAS
ncbi:MULTISPECIES: glycosyltransferase [unclassified Ensifer]|uniref:glycosyltransferase n=1 Tax=unclassified Ensifer TaxID=2633371 RepID=UPI000813C10E|nr:MULTISPECIES: glycosyltransferase [unclassified Ensifer]OCP18647.1 hypothetical protein BC361_31735 [Ensifer sp. LC54]OCP18686.1 hypothetical protein BC363_32045 [Ensifer sp. LC384]